MAENSDFGLLQSQRKSIVGGINPTVNALVGEGDVTSDLEEVKGALDYLIESEKYLLGIEGLRAKTIYHLAQRLKDFGKDHFDFFLDGLTEGDIATFDRSRSFSAESILGQIVFQLGEDVDLLLRAANQRRIDEYRKTLELADQLAYHALQKAETALGYINGETKRGEPYTVLTYFQKAYEIRVIPYAPIALIGIPFTAMRNSVDFLAIPHEIGHYVYYHRLPSYFGKRPSRRYLELNNKGQWKIGEPFCKWQEETYADISGALLAGSIMALDFQELMKRYERGYFVGVKGDNHPTPFLRPLVYTEAFRQKGDAKSKANADSLDFRWTKTLVNILSAGLGFASPLMNLDEVKSEADKIANGSAPDAEKDYAGQVSKALGWLDYSSGTASLGAKAKELVTTAVSITPPDLADNWYPGFVPDQNLTWDKSKMEIELEDPPELEYDEKAPDWEDWIIAQGFFGNDTPQSLYNANQNKPVRFGVGNDTLSFLDEPKPQTTVVGDKEIFNWQALWHADSWTTDPGPGNPPGQP